MQKISRRKTVFRPAWGGVGMMWLALAWALVAVAEDSPVKTAPLRLRIDSAQNSPRSAEMGMVEFAPCLNAAGQFGVFTPAGKPVAFQTYWSAPGEPTCLRFDNSSGERSYYICFATNLPSATGGWRPEAGVLLETRTCTEQPANTTAQVTKLISTAGGTQGRIYVPNVFLGINPFGPSAYYIATFTGWFRISSPGNYRFATVSSGPSWLRVDSQPVVEWLGKHSPNGGRRGEHDGAIQLRAGLHRIDYTLIQFDGPPAAEAAWQPPGTGHFEVMPPSVFVPVARFNVASCEADTEAEQLYFEWHMAGHCAIGDSVAVQVQFRVVNSSKRRTYRWRFDDGSEAVGASLEHFYVLPGLRTVTLEAWEKNERVATNTVRIRVEPVWTQREGWREDVFDAAKKDFCYRGLSRTAARDLAAIINLADDTDERELLNFAGEVMLSRAGEFTSAADCATFLKLGMSFQHQGGTGDALAEKSFRLALASDRVQASVAEKVKLRLADLLLHWSGGFDEAEKLLGSISGGGLSGDEKRLQQLLHGDLLLARGKTEEARRQFAAVGGRMEAKIAHTASAARLESANILIEHGKFDEAQKMLDRLSFEIPMERMSLASGLPKIRLWLENKEFQRAYTGCRLLSPVAENDPRRSEILYDTVESALALGKTDEARRALKLLLKEFPYSESAAKAKSKWPKF